VLRVAKLGIKKGESNGAEYYLRTMAQNLDQYYSGQGEAPGVWLGSGVAAIAAERGLSFADGQTLDQNGAGVPPVDRTPIYAASWSCKDSSYSLGDM